MRAMLTLLALLAAAPGLAASDLFRTDAVTVGHTVCGDNHLQLLFEGQSAVTDEVSGTLSIRSDLLQAEWEATATLGADGQWTLAAVGQDEWILQPAHELCDCVADSASAECSAGVADMCGDNVYPEMAAVCDACGATGNLTAPGCVDAVDAAVANVTAAGQCDDGFPALCDCNGAEGSCAGVVDMCAEGEVDDELLCAACTADYTSAVCEGNITATLTPMVESQQCGEWDHYLCDCEGEDIATSVDCQLATSGLCYDGSDSGVDAYSNMDVCLACFVTTNSSSAECEAAQTAMLRSKIVNDQCGRVYEAPDFCLCELDSTSDDCAMAVAAVCYTDALGEYDNGADLCAECLGDPGSAECVAEIDAALAAEHSCNPIMCYCEENTSSECAAAVTKTCTDDLANNYDLCVTCLYGELADCLTLASGTYAAQTCVSAPVDPDAVCDEAPSADECAALNREQCGGGNACGACIDDYTGDVAPSNEPCTGVLEGCELFVITGGDHPLINGTYYEWDVDGDPYVEGVMHWVEVMPDGSCDDPADIYWLPEGPFWGLDQDLSSDNSIYYAIMGTNVQLPPVNSYFDVSILGFTDFDMTITCMDEVVDRSVPQRLARRIRESSIVGAPDAHDSFALTSIPGVDDGFCTDFMWIEPHCELTEEGCRESVASNLLSTSVDDRRVVGYAPDEGEYARLVEQDALGEALKIAQLPNGTVVVADYEAFKMFDLNTGAYVGNLADLWVSDRHSEDIYVQLDQSVVYLGYGTNTDDGSSVKSSEVEVFLVNEDGSLEWDRAWCSAWEDEAGWSRGMSESFDGQWLYIMWGIADDTGARGRVLKCPTPANPDYELSENVSTWDIALQVGRVCHVGCEIVSDTGIDFEAGGIHVLPDDSYLASNPTAGTIGRFAADGSYIGEFASATSTGIPTFTPNDMVASPRHDAVYVSDNAGNSPYVFDYDGNLLGTLAPAKGYATSGGGLVVAGGMFAPNSNFSLSGSFVAGDELLVRAAAVDDLGAIVEGSSNVVVTFSSFITVGGTELAVELEADVSPAGDGWHTAVYTPTVTGSYSVSVTDGVFGTNLGGSPMAFSVVSAPVDAAASTMAGEGLLTHAAGTTAEFTVTFVDEFGNVQASVGDVSAAVTVGAAELATDVQDNGDGTFTVSYYTDTAGQHLVSVYHDGDAVGASPVVVFVSGGDASGADTTVVSSAAVDVPEGVAVEQLVAEYTVDVEPRDSFGNLVGEVGLDVGVVGHAATVVSEEDLGASLGVYRVTVLVDGAETGAYLTITLDGAEIDASPYALDYKVTVETAGETMFGLFAAVAGLGMLFTAAVALFTFVKRHDRVMNAASPIFLFFILLGAGLEFLVAILFGVDSSVSGDAGLRESVCRARPWVIGLGFQLVFGSLFAKTWRIAKIFDNVGLKRVTCKTSTLLKILAGFVLVEVLYLAAWTGLDPMDLTTEVKSATASETVVFERCVSDSQGLWLAINYGMKAVLLFWGCRLAYRVRNVQGRFNESKWIALCLYNMLIMGAILVPVSHLVWDSAVASFLLASAGTILSTVAVICLLFGHKFLVIVVYNGSAYGASAATTGTQSTVSGDAKVTSPAGSSAQVTGAGGDDAEKLKKARQQLAAVNQLLVDERKVTAELRAKIFAQGNGVGEPAAGWASPKPAAAALAGRKQLEPLEVTSVRQVDDSVGEAKDSPPQGASGRVVPSS